MKAKRTGLIIFGVFIVMVAVPFVVNLIFKSHTEYEVFVAEWTPDGYLSYLGAIIGAFATILAVRITIEHGRKQQLKDRIISSQPWISSETTLLNSNDDIKNEENGTTVFVFLNGELFSSSKQAPYLIQSGKHEINKSDCAIKYYIENNGGNSATKVKLTLNDYPLFPDFVIGKDRSKTIIFILPIKEDEQESKYKLGFLYGDVVSDTIYNQSESLIIKRDELGVTFAQGNEDLLTAPKKEDASNG